MEKYKFRATVCFVFLIVSLLIAGLFAWIAIRESNKNITNNEKKQVLKESKVNYREIYYEEAVDVVNKAVLAVGLSDFYNSMSVTTCKEIRFNVIEDVFTKEALDKLKAKATLKNDAYVDCNNTFKNNFTGVLKHAYTNDAFVLSLVSLDYESKTMVLKDDDSFVVLKYVDNKWLIDLF